MFNISDRTPFAYSLFCFDIELLKLEVMRMFSKHHSNQRYQLEMITFRSTRAGESFVRKMEASMDFTFIIF